MIPPGEQEKKDEGEKRKEDMGYWSRRKGHNVWVEPGKKMCCHDAKNSTYFCPRGPECDFCKDAREVELSPTLELGSPWASDDDEPTPSTIPKEHALVDNSQGQPDWDESWGSWWDELVPKENSHDNSEVSTTTPKGDALDSSGCSTGWDESWDSWWDEIVSAAAVPKENSHDNSEVSTTTPKGDALDSSGCFHWLG